MEIFHKPQCNILSLQQEITVSWFTTTRITFCSKFDIWHTYTINKNIFKLIKHVQCYLQYKLCFPEQFKKTKRKVLGKTYEIRKKKQRKYQKTPKCLWQILSDIAFSKSQPFQSRLRQFANCEKSEKDRSIQGMFILLEKVDVLFFWLMQDGGIARIGWYGSFCVCLGPGKYPKCVSNFMLLWCKYYHLK